ncbi:hypothetical protein HanHA300_Chr12g0458451 [Helianthus annuus]|nr:hypothetical protein HanHA300_Chr12g0458451 [Helianthus annuus]KAJ0494985.1 hypothetical protein HanIR_Chr12g0603741 [Helianthus annuus]KAJ0506612.1 hypothetical protein HanHA89_Chr12g0484051 [Helianthus annuus]KAJ0676286.1 hypothetical protein HanLR1_Chr12g0461021 [Helianthus annuus]
MKITYLALNHLQFGFDSLILSEFVESRVLEKMELVPGIFGSIRTHTNVRSDVYPTTNQYNFQNFHLWPLWFPSFIVRVKYFDFPSFLFRFLARLIIPSFDSHCLL